MDRSSESFRNGRDENQRLTVEEWDHSKKEVFRDSAFERTFMLEWLELPDLVAKLLDFDFRNGVLLIRFFERLLLRELEMKKSIGQMSKRASQVSLMRNGRFKSIVMMVSKASITLFSKHLLCVETHLLWSLQLESFIRIHDWFLQLADPLQSQTS